jgi:Family of unknown function (DUF5372)
MLPTVVQRPARRPPRPLTSTKLVQTPQGLMSRYPHGWSPGRHHSDVRERTARVTHPFHQWEDRVFFLNGQRGQHSLPVGWTDVLEANAFFGAAAGRCRFRLAALAALAGVIDEVYGKAGSVVVKVCTPTLIKTRGNLGLVQPHEHRAR